MGGHFEQRASQTIQFGWGHGRYADMWSILHLLSGVIFGTLALLLGVPPLYALLAIIGGAIVYEGLELIAGVVEDAENSLTDIILAGIGASIALYGFDTLRISTENSALILVMAIGGNLMLLHRGWHAYLKRKTHVERSHKYMLMGLQAVTLVGILGMFFVVVKWVG